jgi:hypothetical protein
VDVSHGGEESCGGEDPDSGHGQEILNRGNSVAEALELVFEGGGLGFELPDFLEGLKEGVTKKSGDQVMVEGAVGVGQERPSALGDRNAEFSKNSADSIDAGRTTGEVSGAQAVEGRDGLLVQSFNRDSGDLLVTSGL